MARGPIQKKNGFWADFVNAALMRPVYREAETRAETTVTARRGAVDRIIRPDDLVVVSSSILNATKSSTNERVVPKVVIATAAGRRVWKSAKTGRFVSRAARSSRSAGKTLVLPRVSSMNEVVPTGESVISVHAATKDEGVQVLKEWLAAVEAAREQTDAPKQGV